MKKFLPFVVVCAMLLANSCMKCNTCKQYCSYCETASGLRVKSCATKDVNQAQVDSIYLALKAAGYTCRLLEESKDVCDYPSKLNDATNYYYKQDYYCYPKQ